jgi:hypothetical protein
MQTAPRRVDFKVIKILHVGHTICAVLARLARAFFAALCEMKRAVQDAVLEQQILSDHMQPPGADLAIEAYRTEIASPL